ncbi:conserved hypothetical protein [Myxococcus xanthus DK 1622]|uniref:RING-type domain-containing protein n=1 Tax=Myxococcus xanthus (strain DK1622) TaxID=246197 RepID=Q1CZ12_MYXXD|nr:conserved hypothetical protein [Myxococcus xanthus DK 1622]
MSSSPRDLRPAVTRRRGSKAWMPWRQTSRGGGYTLDGALREALLALPTEIMAASGRFIYDNCAALRGANRPFVPLFRNFPESVPHDTRQLYVQRMLGWLFQSPEQPCIHCGAQGTVRALSPCAHLVCERCYDGSDYSACPICHRRLSPSEPFLKPTALEAAERVYALAVNRLTRLSLGTDAARHRPRREAAPLGGCEGSSRGWLPECAQLARRAREPWKGHPGLFRNRRPPHALGAGLPSRRRAQSHGAGPAPGWHGVRPEAGLGRGHRRLPA